MGNSNLQCGRVFCIGRNYVEHIQELSNATPTKPLFFIKPASCLVRPGEKIHFPKHGNELHHEVEVVVQISRGGKVKTEEEARSVIGFITLGLDLTLRDVQDEQKKKGLPWEIAKAFDQSSPLGNFIPFDKSIDLKNISFACKVNSIEKQRGNTGHMMISIQKQLVELSKIWSLLPGDLVYTGTPSGVGPLKIGDTIEIESDAIGSFAWSIIE
jgi:2-keto-4-pentenoate hydratase/2-oxohepta-3-ene-1,7-dioic acid hydratase in catechol pathway